MSHSESCHFRKPCHSSRRAPTLVPSESFAPEEDVEDLWNALHSDSTDVKKIIDILANRTLSQRLDIVNKYREAHNGHLVQDLKDKLNGDIETLIVAMMTPLDQYYAEELNYAIVGLGTDENDLIEILCSLNNAEIKAVKRAYHQKYSVHLGDDISDDTSGDFRTLLETLCKIERDESMPTDEDAASADVQALINASSDNRFQVFNDILCHRSYDQLILIFVKYDKTAGTSIEKAIQDHFSGDVKNGLLAIVAVIKDPARFFSQQLYNSMVGWGTRDRDLMRIVVRRSEIDMADIKKEYEAQYSQTLAAAIIDDTSGDYQKCLLILIGEA